MSIEEAIEILENFDYNLKHRQFSTYDGLTILRKYVPTADIEYATHDRVYSVEYFEDISLDDFTELCKLNWGIDKENERWTKFV
jgi:hypothetical protein